MSSEVELELKLCPFCGDPADLHERVIEIPGSPITKYAVYCTGCAVEQFGDTDRERAVRNWNRRSNPEPKEGRVR